MVKNEGGNKNKRQGRKFINASKESTKLRVIETEGEMFGQVTSMLGNGRCHVVNTKGEKLLCIIRGRFRGRNRRDNNLSKGTWVLIGLYEWETEKGGKGDDINKCDLLEVYSDCEKERLKNCVNEDWSVFVQNDCANTFTKETDDAFTFGSGNLEEYRKMMDETKETITIQSSSVQEEEIDFDDI